MRITWRFIAAARNSYAALYAAAEKYGYILELVDSPADGGDVICYSLNSLDYPEYVDEIRSAEQITIVGGPHPSACLNEVSLIADYVVVGEGERTLPRLLAALDAGEGEDAKIPGVASRDSGFVPVDHSVRLDAFPSFSRMKGYIELSRGCPFSCAYCQTPCLHGRKMRHLSREAIVSMAEKYQDARFVTPNAFAYGSADGRVPDVEKLRRLLSSMPKNNIYFGTFPSEVRPEFVIQETAELVTEFCSNTKLHFGVQSGSDAVLRKMGRGHTVADVYSALEICKKVGLTPVVDVIFGFPFASDEDEEVTLALVREVTRYGTAHVHYLTPLPGTPLAGSTPRDILPEIDTKLGQLALSGRVTGYWHDKFSFYSNTENASSSGDK